MAPRQKAKNVVFLKTHKTGSSTIQNVLFRFATHNGLQLALNRNPDAHLLGYRKAYSCLVLRDPNLGSLPNDRDQVCSTVYNILYIGGLSLKYRYIFDMSKDFEVLE